MLILAPLLPWEFEIAYRATVLAKHCLVLLCLAMTLKRLYSVENAGNSKLYF